jgi:hypothetical protein
MNTMLRVTDVKPLEGHRLRVSFNDGVVRDVDCSFLLRGTLGEPLRDLEYFRTVRVALGRNPVAHRLRASHTSHWLGQPQIENCRWCDFGSAGSQPERVYRDGLPSPGRPVEAWRRPPSFCVAYRVLTSARQSTMPAGRRGASHASAALGAAAVKRRPPALPARDSAREKRRPREAKSASGACQAESVTTSRVAALRRAASRTRNVAAASRGSTGGGSPSRCARTSSAWNRGQSPRSLAGLRDPLQPP